MLIVDGAQLRRLDYQTIYASQYTRPNLIFNQCRIKIRKGFPNTRLITCRSSKKRRYLNGVGECEGSKYVCTSSHIESPMFL